MSTTAVPGNETPWQPLSAAEIAELLGDRDDRWWLSGGVALDRWLGEAIRKRPNSDVSTTPRAVVRLLADLPARYRAWVDLDGALVPVTDAPEGTDLQPVLVHDAARDSWVLQVNVEDGTEGAWLYRRDPRLQVPWDRAVLDVGGIPTGAPAIQLLWKAFAPRPEDDVDYEAALPRLSDEDRAWLERALLRIHPHSSWAIHVRSPFAPAKASWNRKRS